MNELRLPLHVFLSEITSTEVRRNMQGLKKEL